MADLRTRLEKILDDHLEKGVVGVSLALSLPGQDDQLLARGLADKFRGTPMSTDHIFRIACPPYRAS